MYVTLGDVERIKCLSARTVFLSSAPEPEYLDQDDTRSGGTMPAKLMVRRVLVKQPNGDSFLGPRGCQLPLEVRRWFAGSSDDYTAEGIGGAVAGLSAELFWPARVCWKRSLTLAIPPWHEQLYHEIQLEPVHA